MKIIGIAGLKGSGKDTLACYLIGQQHAVNDSCRTIIVAFADALKRMLLPLGYPEEVLWGSTDKRDWVHPVLGVSARLLLQHVGTEGCRGVDPDFWVKAWKDQVDKLATGFYGYERTLGVKQLKSAWSNPVLVITPDLRFANEHAEMERRAEAYTVLIERDQSDAVVDEHASERWCREAAAQCVCEVVNNNGTKDELQERARLVLLSAGAFLS